MRGFFCPQEAAVGLSIQAAAEAKSLLAGVFSARLLVCPQALHLSTLALSIFVLAQLIVNSRQPRMRQWILRSKRSRLLQSRHASLRVSRASQGLPQYQVASIVFRIVLQHRSAFPDG